MSIISDTVKYWRLAFGLRGFLRSPVSLEESKQVITTALLNRERTFLSLVQKAIYQNPKSPYFKLLQMAGCEYGDFEKLVRSEGIEPALRRICEAGVYISIEEFKGRKEVTRGGETFAAKESDFDNPFLVKH